MEPSDRELVEQATRGDRSAFDALVRRHGPAILNLLRRALGRDDVVDDLFQETFLRAYRAIGRLQEADRLRAWLAAIAMNRLRRHLEKTKRRRVFFAHDTGEAEESLLADPPDRSEASDPAAGLDRTERRRALQRAIDRLPPRQRAVLSLRLDLELPYREIASMLGITEENARACHYQALKSLRRRLPALLGASTEIRP